ncbi:MAG: hypothetical protein Q8L71_05990 [Thiobacillus sp.]|nr:hypothetical protein [Thiobacillus sp.]
MTRMTRTALSTTALALARSDIAQTSPCAGEQQRTIKSLDARDVRALRQGQGMGLARAAGLNGCPGPMHTRELGEAVVQAETALDQLFNDRQAMPPRVSKATQRGHAEAASSRDGAQPSGHTHLH